MGLFKQGRRPAARLIVKAPVSGEVKPLASLNDGVFSEALLGPGCVIEPNEDELTAPFAGEVVMVAATKHAIGLMSDEGVELMLHVGLDTVNLNGEGFQVEVQPKTHVRAGERLMRFSREQIQTAGYPDGVVVIVTNARLFKQVETLKEGMIKAQEDLLSVSK
ncbi:PTS sugar transporter subunit IIA [Holdemania filiformis]|uniref:PTS sugar transporter subunit IIA n=1 Tax=Holdemania filiformis TaxID=61171 RepID=UPI00266EF787|nr:PTS glucose transporter subunit IIA [Holdemania filiformis]